MKNIVIGSAIAIALFTACSNSSNTTTADTKNIDTQQPGKIALAKVDNAKGTPVKEVINQYLHLKNALATDEDKAAASAGNAMVDALAKLDTAAFTAGQKKVYDDVADDVKENAEHIGKNADKIAHQREHFELLSRDMYDLVKVFGSGQPLYQDYCPMYNNKKGATWLSETKEIRNPYLGKEMPACGEVKEEIKQQP